MNFINKFISPRSVVFMNYRNYPRWTSRTPLKVLSPQEEENREPENDLKQLSQGIKTKNDSLQEAIKIKWRYQVDSASPTPDEIEEIEREAKTKKKKPKPTSNTTTAQTTDMLEATIDENGDFIYTKMKNNDTRVGQILTTVKSRKSLQKRDLILLEGKRLIKDALQAGCILKYLLFSRKTEIEYLKPHLPKLGAKIYKMPYKEMQMWSDLTTTPGIMGVFKTPNPENYETKKPIPLTVYCDNVREPGNLGAILRVAASAGCEKVLLSTGCTHLWDSKVTRSSAGSHFRVKIVPKKSIDDLREEMGEKRNKLLFIADNNLLNVEENDNQENLQELVNQIPIIPYYDVNIRDVGKKEKEIVLVIGGETCGIHADVYKLAREFNGIRINIPMSNGVESLNTGTALGVITFEFYRQLKTDGSLN